MVHQEKVFINQPKIEAEIAWDPETQQYMIIDIEDAIDFVSLFKITYFKEKDDISIGDIILQPIKFSRGVDRVYKTTHKTFREVDGFKVEKKIC